MNDTILAIDLGRYKSMACIFQRSTRHARFHTFDSTPKDLTQLLEQHPHTLVVIEACANAGWVHDLAVQRGHPVKVANTAAEAWKFQHLKRKTDKDDALRLAELEAIGQLPTVVMPEPADRQWKMTIAFRQELVGRRTACQNRIRALFASQGMPMPNGAAAWSQLGIEGIALQAKPLDQCGPLELWQGLLHIALAELRELIEKIDQTERRLDAIAKTNASAQLLETIPGVGPRTAETIVAHLGDPHRFASAKQVGAYAGLVPTQYQSGVTDRKGRITRRGPALLRKLLVECSWCMLRYNSWARTQYARLTRGGSTRKKPAIVALARKLLIRCWVMLKTNQAWRPDPVPAATPA